MPLLSIETNVNLNQEKATQLAQALSKATAGMLSKPESYVMVKLNINQNMLFAGTDEPLVYLELKSLGLPEEKTATFSEELCALLGKNTGVAANRIYIEFASPSRHMWGWNSATF